MYFVTICIQGLYNGYTIALSHSVIIIALVSGAPNNNPPIASAGGTEMAAGNAKPNFFPYLSLYPDQPPNLFRTWMILLGCTYGCHQVIQLIIICMIMRWGKMRNIPRIFAGHFDNLTISASSSPLLPPSPRPSGRC